MTSEPGKAQVGRKHMFVQNDLILIRDVYGLIHDSIMTNNNVLYCLCLSIKNIDGSIFGYEFYLTNQFIEREDLFRMVWSLSKWTHCKAPHPSLHLVTTQRTVRAIFQLFWTIQATSIDNSNYLGTPFGYIGMLKCSIPCHFSQMSQKLPQI